MPGGFARASMAEALRAIENAADFGTTFPKVEPGGSGRRRRGYLASAQSGDRRNVEA